MKGINKIYLILLALVAAFFLIALLLPSKLEISMNKMIKADKKVVYRQVNILKNWEPWSPFLEADPSMSIVYAGPPSGIGAKLSWKSENMDNGTLEIVNANVFESIVLDVTIGKNEGVMDFDMLEKGDSTKITWTFETQLKYPFQPYLALFIKPKIEKLFQDGLINLAYIASRFETTLVISRGQIEAAYALSVVDSSAFNDLHIAQAKVYQEIADYVNTLDAEINGPAYCIFYRYNPGRNVIFEAGYPIDRIVKDSGRIRMVNTPSGEVVTGSHFGPHTGLMDTHAEIQKYITKNEMVWNGPPWEVYVTDTQREPDTSRWQTKIFYPVKK